MFACDANVPPDIVLSFVKFTLPILARGAVVVSVDIYWSYYHGLCPTKAIGAYIQKFCGRTEEDGSLLPQSSPRHGGTTDRVSLRGSAVKSTLRTFAGQLPCGAYVNWACTGAR